ncbi:MAG: hypothetical protein F6K32_02685 [Desertifilum sp. SIO1I2]|nr:hypothetical protein [Desertifilum sp. SIO1I2]
MRTILLPLRAVVFQLLLIVVAIAIESFLFHVRFGYGRKTCVEYAALTNLTAVILGWLTFFYVELVLPIHLEDELMGFIFFGQWTSASLFWLTLIGIMIFFSSLAVKIKTFEMIEAIQKYKIERFIPEVRKNNEFQKKVKNFQSTGIKSFILLQAHSVSHVAILLILAAHLLKNRL